MKRFLLALVLLGLSAPAVASLDTPPVDTRPLEARLSAMESGPGVQFTDVKMKAEAAYAASPFARIKWAGSAMATDSTGTKVISIPANKMSTGVVCGITIRTSGAFATPSCVPVGTPSTGYTVTITFTKLKTAVTIPAIVLGAAATVLPMLEPMGSTGVVVFDIGFTEPDVIGP